MGLSIKKLSETWDVSRPTIHKKINNGELSKLNDGTIDPSEFMRVFPNAKARSVNYTPVNKVLKTEYPPDFTRIEVELKYTKERLQDAEKRATAAESEKEWLRGQIDKLTDGLKLLEAPKTNEPLVQAQRPKKTNWLIYVLAAILMVLVIGAFAFIALNTKI